MPRTPSSALAAALLLTLAFAAEAHAQGVSLSRAGSGARAAGMGDAFVAVSDDGTAASWNPAGLAQLRQPEFSFVYAFSDQGLDLSGLRSPDDQSLFAYRFPISGDARTRSLTLGARSNVYWQANSPICDAQSSASFLELLRRYRLTTAQYGWW